MRKSRREKEKEAADAKAREEEEDAAKAYAEFLDEFDDKGAGKKKSGLNFVNATDRTVYSPALKDNQSSGPPRPPRAFDSAVSDIMINYFEVLKCSPKPSNGPKPKGKRAMDAFLEEIKRYDEHFRDQSRYLYFFLETKPTESLGILVLASIF